MDTGFSRRGLLKGSGALALGLSGGGQPGAEFTMRSIEHFNL